MGTDPSRATQQLARDEPAVIALVDRAVASRDAAAFGELYDRFVERVYRYLHLRTGRQAEAEELTEQVFLQAWEAVEQYRWQGRPFVAWLYGLAHNVHVDHVRRQRATISLDPGSRPLEVPREPATAELAQRLDADLLVGALSRLRPEEHEVIVLKFVDGLDTRQVALLLDKSEGAVRVLQMRALRSLRRILESQKEGAPDDHS